MFFPLLLPSDFTNEKDDESNWNRKVVVWKVRKAAKAMKAIDPAPKTFAAGPVHI
jgi:hypothetical protein